VTASTYFPLVAGLASADPNAQLSGLVSLSGLLGKDGQVKDVKWSVTLWIKRERPFGGVLFQARLTRAPVTGGLRDEAIQEP
jgi:hypothetical protein